MTVVNPKSISGINSITTGSGSDDILTIHTNNGTERLRVDSTGTTKIVTGIVTTLTATSSAKVGSGVTLSPDGDIFVTGVCTATSFVGDGAGLSNVGVDTGVVFTDKLSVGDSPELISVGVGSDFQINHNGGTGNTNVIQQTGDVYFYTGSDLNLLLKDGAEVALYHSGTKQCETSANGLAFPSGKGIDFSATSDSSGTMTSELLDDYEEGTFTPSLQMSSGGQNLGYEIQLGRYTKIGNNVHIEIDIKLNAISNNGSGTYVKVLGLPYTCATTPYGGFHCPYYNSTNNTPIRGALTQYSDTWAYLYHSFESNGNITPATIANAFGTSTRFILVGSYTAA